MTAAVPALNVTLAGTAEQRQEEHDRERASWLGCPFSRPATVAERVWLAQRFTEMPGRRLLTRVEVLRDGKRRRSWPQLAGRPQRTTTECVSQ